MAEFIERDARWLRETLVEATRANLCTMPGCTTCGTSKFRSLLAGKIEQLLGEEDAASLGVVNRHRLPWVRGKGRSLIIGALLELTEADVRENPGAIEYILATLHRGSSSESFESEVVFCLDRSPVGRALSRMRSRAAARQAHLTEHYRRSDPVRAALLRERKKQFRALKHEIRVIESRLKPRPPHSP